LPVQMLLGLIAEPAFQGTGVLARLYQAFN
jgi:hypothetical protein